MRSSGTHAGRHLAIAAALCLILLGACSKAGSSSTSTTTTTGTSAAAACGLLTKAQVAQATGNGIAFSKQAGVGPVSTCTFGSLSGFAVMLSVTTSPAASLSSDIPGLGNVVSKYNLKPVSGVGDQAYSGASAIIARKGDTVFTIVYAAFGGGNHEQAIKTMATDVAARL